MSSTTKWRPLGNITIADGNPHLPQEACEFPTSIPGIYRLRFKAGGYIYIGKTKDLRRRLGEYCKPMLGTEQEHVLRIVLVEAGGATVEVVPETDLERGRHQAEKDEQALANSEEGALLLNKIARGYGHYLKCKAQYHEAMCGEVRRAGEAWQLHRKESGV